MNDPYNGRYCKDCKWFCSIHGNDSGICNAPSPIDKNWVLGLITISSRGSICGPEGKLWEPKDGEE